MIPETRSGKLLVVLSLGIGLLQLGAIIGSPDVISLVIGGSFLVIAAATGPYPWLAGRMGVVLYGILSVAVALVYLYAFFVLFLIEGSLLRGLAVLADVGIEPDALLLLITIIVVGTAVPALGFFCSIQVLRQARTQV